MSQTVSVKYYLLTGIRVLAVDVIVVVVSDSSVGGSKRGNLIFLRFCLKEGVLTIY